MIRAREVLAIVGVERYGLRVEDLAREMEKSPDSLTKRISRTVRRQSAAPVLLFPRPHAILKRWIGSFPRRWPRSFPKVHWPYA